MGYPFKYLYKGSPLPLPILVSSAVPCIFKIDVVDTYHHPLLIS